LNDFLGTKMHDSNESEYSKSLAVIVRQLNIIFPILLLTIGSIGNLFTVYVYTIKCFRKTSIAFFYTCLAVIDTSILLIGLPKYIIHAFDLVNIVTYSTFTCKFFTTIIYILQQMSSWTLVLASFNRYYSININPIFKFTKSRKFQISSFFVTGFAIVLINLPNLIYLQITYLKQPNSSEFNSTNITMCELGENSIVFNNRTSDILDLFMFAIIPFVLMTISTYLLSKTVFRSRRRFSSNAKPAVLKREMHFSITIICINIMFLIFNLPICILIIIRNFQNEATLTYERQVEYDLAFAIANIWSYMNFSSSFFVHLTFNRLFRIRFVNIFKKNSL
jgi:hypothetical protein